MITVVATMRDDRTVSEVGTKYGGHDVYYGRHDVYYRTRGDSEWIQVHSGLNPNVRTYLERCQRNLGMTIRYICVKRHEHVSILACDRCSAWRGHVT